MPHPLEVIKEMSPIRVVDVGALDVGADQVPYRAILDVAQVIGFEPLEAECAKLNAMRKPGHLYLPYAVGDGRPGTFRMTSAPMCSSLYEPNTDLISRFYGLSDLMKVMRRTEMQTRRLDDISEAAGCDFLKLDVQGAELDVIRGAEKLMAGVLVVHTEVEFVPLYKDQPLFGDIDVALRGAGFLFHKFTGIASRAVQPMLINNNPHAPGTQMLWGEAVYVRALTDFSQIAPDKLKKLAYVLHAVYGSFDLAMSALTYHDIKMGTQWGPQYKQILIYEQQLRAQQQQQARQQQPF